MRNQVGLTRKGAEIDIAYIRDGVEKQTTARIGESEAFVLVESGGLKYFSGARFRDSEIKDGETIAVIVAEVKEGSPAWRFGLRKDDVITSVNRKAVTSVEELMAMLREPHKVIAMNVKRDGRDMFVVVERNEIG